MALVMYIYTWQISQYIYDMYNDFYKYCIVTENEIIIFRAILNMTQFVHAIFTYMQTTHIEQRH